MKKILIYTVGLLCCIFTSSCTAGFEYANTNPNEPSQINPDYLFNSSVYYTLSAFNGEIKKSLLGNYSQYFWGASDQRGRYGNYPSGNDGYWRNCFNTAAFPVRYIYNEKLSDPSYHNRVRIAKIWESYIFSQVIAIWGSVPMENALGGTQAVPYDREETIYYYLLENLKECAQELDPNADKFASDPIYPSANKSSDIVKWQKFANSLRLRLAIRISNDAPNGNPQKAREVISELFANENMLISSSAEECQASWGETDATANYFYQYMIVERVANKDKLNTAAESILQYMAPYDDPRLPEFFTEANPLQIPAGFAWAPYWGEPKTSGTPPGVTITPNPHSGKSSQDYSMMRDEFFEKSYTEMLLGYSEICLLKCEAVYRGLGSGSKSAEEYYNEGVRASMSRFGVSASKTNDYLNVSGIKWNTLSDISGGEAKFKDWTGVTSSAIKATEPDPIYRQIVMQHYIALFYQNLEAWNLIRRTQILEFVPHWSPDTGNGAMTPQGKTFSYIPQRLSYPDNEKNNNTINSKRAILWLVGGDKMDTKLWFAKPTKTNPLLQ